MSLDWPSKFGNQFGTMFNPIFYNWLGSQMFFINPTKVHHLRDHLIPPGIVKKKDFLFIFVGRKGTELDGNQVCIWKFQPPESCPASIKTVRSFEVMIPRERNLFIAFFTSFWIIIPKRCVELCPTSNWSDLYSYLIPFTDYQGFLCLALGHGGVTVRTVAVLWRCGIFGSLHLFTVYQELL